MIYLYYFSLAVSLAWYSWESYVLHKSSKVPFSWENVWSMLVFIVMPILNSLIAVYAILDFADRSGLANWVRKLTGKFQR